MFSRRHVNLWPMLIALFVAFVMVLANALMSEAQAKPGSELPVQASAQWQSKYLEQCNRIERIGQFWEGRVDSFQLVYAGRWLQGIAKYNRALIPQRKYEEMQKAFVEMTSIPNPEGFGG